VANPCVRKRGMGCGEGFCESTLSLQLNWQVGIGELAPHDLRRTAAKVCRSKGVELEQIQFLLGHESILTTERYLGSEQDLKNAVNDALVFE
jgi:integrase